MPIKKHHIKLDIQERQQLEALTRKQKAAASRVQKAKALLAMDCGPHGPALSDSQSAAICGLSISSLEQLRKRVCEVGPLEALQRKPRLTPPVAPKVTGEVEARMVQIACSEPPPGFARWTMQMIAERLVRLQLVDSISDETVRQRLKKTISNPGRKNAGASPQRTTPPS